MAPPPEDGVDTNLRIAMAMLEGKVNNCIEDMRELKQSQAAHGREMRDAFKEFREGVEAREKERSEKEKAQLWSGIKALITVLGALIGLIWAYRTIILGGPPPGS